MPNQKTAPEVRDISTEFWIKMLSGLAGISLLLGAFIGVRAIDKLDQIGSTLAGLVVFVKTNTNEISSLKNADRDILIKIEGNTREIYKLKGAK